MAKKLYLHIGTQKTGSSYLQHLLRLNAARLAERDVSYTNFTNDYVSSGNGDLLLKAINDEIPLPDFRKILEAHYGDRETAIISSELLYSVDMNWKYLFNKFQQCDVRAELIVYFRNPVDYLISSYSQMVKRHGYVGELGEFVAQRPTDLYDAPMRKIVSAVESEAYPLGMNVLSYDASRRRLWEGFLEICKLEAAHFEKEDVVVNAALSAEAAKLHRIYNRYFPEDGTGEFSSFLEKANLFRTSTAIGVTKDEFHAIREKYEAKLEFLNEFVTGPVIEIAISKPLEKSPAAYSLDLEGVDGVLGFLYSQQSRLLTLLPELRKMVLRAREDVPEKAQVMELCPDFDPLGYLILHPELVLAKVNPYEHYLKFGRDEGRQYKLLPSIEGRQPES